MPAPGRCSVAKPWIPLPESAFFVLEPCPSARRALRRPRGARTGHEPWRRPSPLPEPAGLPSRLPAQCLPAAPPGAPRGDGPHTERLERRPAQRIWVSQTGTPPSPTRVVERLFVKLCEVLESGTVGVDAGWFANRSGQSCHPHRRTREQCGRRRRHRRRDLGRPPRRGGDGRPRRRGHRDPVARGAAKHAEASYPPGQGAGCRSRRPQAVHRGPRRQGRAPIGHQQSASRPLRRLRDAPGRPGQRGALDQPRRSARPWTRGPRGYHHASINNRFACS